MANTVVISSGVMVMQPQKVVTGVWSEGELPTMVSEA
jgi:hypothetical protein